LLRLSLVPGLVFGLVCANIACAADTAPEALHSKGGTAHAAAQHGKTAPVPTPFVPMDAKLAIQKANTYFNQTASMIADFVQIGGDGRRAEGKIFVEKPGKLRFEYAAPATLDVIADGTTVAVIDRKVGSVQQYFIWQTPLKFLLKADIDLARDVQILDVTSEPETLTILVEDKQVFGGPTRIKLMFDPSNFMLKQWMVTDPQGYETLVSLFNQDFTTKPDPTLFQLYQSSSK
jgi:outer membrane lipoprotein-sorting protein